MLNRPYALLQWVQQANISEKYVLMSEPDHIWLKPMPNLMRGQRCVVASVVVIACVDAWMYGQRMCRL